LKIGTTRMNLSGKQFTQVILVNSQKLLTTNGVGIT
jgi:hypothetical protein